MKFKSIRKFLSSNKKPSKMEYSKIIAEAKGRFSNQRLPNFSLPQSMMEHIQKKWSLEAYEKLIKTCKYFYASQPWMVIDISEDYSNFCRILNEGLKKNLKIWVAGEFHASSGRRVFLDLCDLTSEDRFIQLLRSIRFSSLKYLSIFDRELSYSDYVLLAEFKSLKSLSLTNINVTTEDDVYEICFLDDLLTPLKNIETFMFDSENGSDYYLECAKRLADFTVPQPLRELIITQIPEYISFEYFHRFLKKNPSMALLRLEFDITNDNNTFIKDVKSFYSKKPISKKSESKNSIDFKIIFGKLKIEASFYKPCRNCNQGIANKFPDRELCPSDAVHWVCEDCCDDFEPGDPCPFCLAGI